ncbi:hypothetical protein Tco_0647066 [Tanacetum coccineum]
MAKRTKPFYSVEEIIWMKFVLYAVLEMEIHLLMIQIRILSMILQIFPTTLHNPSTRRILMSYVGMMLTMQNQPENIQALLLKLINDLQILNGIQLKQEEQAAKVSSQYWKPPIVYDDDDEESSIPLRDIISELPLSELQSPRLSDYGSSNNGDKHLNTILETESDEVIKSSVENLVLIPSESEDTSESDSDCDLPSCDDFSPINVSKEKFMTFSNLLFDSNNDFTSSDDESLSDEDVPKDNVKIYSNPLFKFDEEYISSDVNPLFDEVLEHSGPALLVTPLSDFNEDECFNPGGDVDEIKFLLHHDPSTPKLSVAYILEGFTDEPPLKENDDLFDLESKENE